MSGTINNAKQKQRASQAASQDIAAAKAKRRFLARNRGEAKKLILKAFGWEKLELFAEDMLEKAFCGKCIDTKQLAKDLENWKNEQ
jgi:hypothetical protein